MPNETMPQGPPFPDGNKVTGRRSGHPDPVPDDNGENLVLVQFKGHRKSYYHNRRNLDLAVGQYCLVEADRGRDMGRIKYVGPGKREWWELAQKQGVVAEAGAQDLARLHDNRGDEWEFWDICREKILDRKLKMNLVTVERQFDHKKITFYFTAEKRVDFRDLVRDLAGIFRTRIELRQIGVRDEARLKGGLGVCGREFCCSTFLHEFVPVTLKMAKVQQLPLNPSKLSGPCGRLRCCLTYENDVYRRARIHLPRVGSLIVTPDGTGTVRKLDLLQETVSVSRRGTEGLTEWPAEKLWWDHDRNLPDPGSAGGCGKPDGCRGGPDEDCPGSGGRH
jgi:cell fate regulator YaaT (PSP1 superfamily)